MSGVLLAQSSVQAPAVCPVQRTGVPQSEFSFAGPDPVDSLQQQFSQLRTSERPPSHSVVQQVSPRSSAQQAPHQSHNAKEADFVKIGEFLHRGIELALEIQNKAGKKLVDFLAALDSADFTGKISALNAEVEAFAGAFPMPGH